MAENAVVATRKAIGQTLRSRRLERNLKQREIASQANIDYTYLSKIETGSQVPSVDALVRITEALGLSSTETKDLFALLGRIPDSVPPQERRRYFGLS